MSHKWSESESGHCSRTPQPFCAGSSLVRDWKSPRAGGPSRSSCRCTTTIFSNGSRQRGDCAVRRATSSNSVRLSASPAESIPAPGASRALGRRNGEAPGATTGGVESTASGRRPGRRISRLVCAREDGPLGARVRGTTSVSAGTSLSRVMRPGAHGGRARRPPRRTARHGQGDGRSPTRGVDPPRRHAPRCGCRLGPGGDSVARRGSPRGGDHALRSIVVGGDL